MPVRIPVVQVAASLNHFRQSTTSETFDQAIDFVLSWLRTKQNLRLPEIAATRQPFEIDASEGDPVSAVRVGNFWALQFDKIDPDIPGRLWRNEISICHDTQHVLAGVRLSIIDREEGLRYFVSVPRIISSLIRQPGMHDYGVPLLEVPIHVRTESQLENLVTLIRNPQRLRPVVVFTPFEDGREGYDAEAAAGWLAGLAHVYVLDARYVRPFAAEVGPEFAVFDGGIRTYNPDFDPLNDEVYRHPFAKPEWLEIRFEKFEHFVFMLLRQFAARSVRNPRNEDAMPSFRSVRQASVQHQLNSLKVQQANRSDREALLEIEVELLKQQVAEKTEEYNYADGEVKQYQQERDQYRAQIISLREYTKSLEDAAGKAPAQNVPIPTSFDDIGDWVKRHLPGRMLLLNRAARSARKSPFEDIAIVYRSLLRLGREYVDARRNGNPVETIFDDLGVKLERTGDPATLSQWFELYHAQHRGKNEFFEWHLTRGSDANERNTLRIYFFWDDEDQIVVVGHLPGHLPNTKS